mmetsp:Transcript_21825/g.40157  ORF Transcript_21825/g.40157 Transcript_21825/m.40157 type:complete len:181 (-) Transcript_21825:50-592(-)
MTFECNICLEQAYEPVVTRCGHLFCWGCLHQWLNAPGQSQATQASSSSQSSGVAPDPSTGASKTGCVCPICKATVTMQNVIPVYTRGNQTDPRNVYPDLPARPPGERPEPEPASILGMQTFAHGGVPESYGYSAGFGYYPAVFGMNWQRGSILEPPSTSKSTSYLIIGLSCLYFAVLFLL